MEQIIRIGMDTSKHVFQLHGVNAAEHPVLRKKLRRREMIAFFQRLAPTVIAIEACGASHHWARLLSSFGHEVKLIAPQLVKPYVKRGKNDAADAEALCEAMSRPTMRFVPNGPKWPKEVFFSRRGQREQQPPGTSKATFYRPFSSGEFSEGAASGSSA